MTPKPAPAPSLAATKAPASTPEWAWMHTTHFWITAAEVHQLPACELPEIAFVGRSNAGKSTAINTLCQQKQLAYASKRPGRTQHINLFKLGRHQTDDAVLADLPGYGYAAVPESAKIRWQKEMAHYLDVRRNLAGVVLLCDPRLGLTDLDQRLIEFVKPRLANGEVKLLVLLTKSDKLSRSEAGVVLSQTRRAIPPELGDVMMFSSLKKQGVLEVAAKLHAWCHPTSPVDEQP